MAGVLIHRIVSHARAFHSLDRLKGCICFLSMVVFPLSKDCVDHRQLVARRSRKAVRFHFVFAFSIMQRNNQKKELTLLRR